MSNFDSTKERLVDTLRKVTSGEIQLPDFQRGWVWDDEHIRSLLVSIARSFPIGALMMLETGGDVQFQVRPVESVEVDPLKEPDQLILDGQQRLTSLTQVLALSKPVSTYDEKRRFIKRYYYIDINSALNGNIEDAFISVEEDLTVRVNFGRDIKQVKNSDGAVIDLDFSSIEKECKAFYFPCNQIIKSDEWEVALHKFAPEKFSKYMEFRTLILDKFRNYQIPIIKLDRSNTKEAVCLVFEKVNTGGVPLSVFELVTATFAADGYNLRDDWVGKTERNPIGRYTRIIKKEPILRGVQPTDYLQAISLLSTYKRKQGDIAAGKIGKSVSAVSAKRGAILSLSVKDYHEWADLVENGFLLVAKFLRKECFFSEKDLPYRTQIAPLAAILAILKERWLEPKIYNKLSQWFWCGVLGELYGGAVETRIANDFEDILGWIGDDSSTIRTIYDASFQSNRLNTLRSRLSAAYKGLNILLLRQGAQDFFWKETVQRLEVEEVALDIHHIFPQKWCEDREIHPSIYNSILNKTPISYKSNRMIGGKAPSQYIQDLQKHPQVKLNDEGMNEILCSHLIPVEQLRADNFESFLSERQAKFLTLISNVMGKVITD